jgi:hypothetical protein
LNPDLPLGTRLRAATEAAKYTHPRMAVIATTPVNGLAEMLDKAIAASQAAREPKLIGTAVRPNGHKSTEAVSAKHMTEPFSSLRRRF